LPTLSQYIHPDNIPKKYGGNLDFNWGDMPHLEPEIESAIKWVDPDTQRGQKTLPIGPMIWEKSQDGVMTAIAVGTEKGQPRRRTIFTIPNPVNAKPKADIPNTPIDEAELALTTVGTATQPPDPDPATVDLEPSPSDTPTASETPRSDIDLPIREGTSHTRFEQQNQTHASGQLADGTPEAAVNNHGHGDKTITMEPSTVGQAPKDVSIRSEEPEAPGYLDQAKQVAAQASAVVTSTVESAAEKVAGLAGGSNTQKKVEEKIPEKSPEEKEMEAKIDQKDGPVIEDFLREKTSSRKV
jgi:hypothetical protein